MPTIRKIRLCTLAALALVASACESTTGPDFGIFDADAAAADYATLDTMFATEGWAGFQALGTRTPYGAPAATDAVASLGDVRSGRAFAIRLANRMREAAASGGGLAQAPIISETHRGATFVYDPALDQYAVDPDRTGAPPTGVRFIVYRVDDHGDPILEQEIGYADLIDEGDASAEDVALRLVVVANDVTVLDYATTLDIGLGQGALTVEGFLQGDGNARLEFDIRAVGTHFPNHSTLDVTFDLAVEARDFSITGAVSGIEEGTEGEGDVELTVRHRTNSVRLDLSGANGQIDGTVYLNDRVFATVTGAATNPTILSGTGEPLTTEELIVLHHIVDVVEDVFDFLEDLVDPVDEIVFLGIIL